MFWLLRIDQAKWFDGLAYVRAGEFQADALKDLQTRANKLSAWSLQADRRDLTRIVVALAANRERLGAFDYALVEKEAIAGLGVRHEPSPGSTPDGVLNATLHNDLVELDGSRVVDIGKVVLADHRDRVLPKRVKELLVEGLRSGTLDRSKVKSSLVADLE